VQREGGGLIGLTNTGFTGQLVGFALSGATFGSIHDVCS
jgi:hypothetical protein